LCIFRILAAFSSSGEALSIGTVLGEGVVCFPKARATARAILRELMETGKAGDRQALQVE
jgi:hypothetical protein